MMPPHSATILQSILLPGLDFGAPEDMYVRCLNEKARACLTDRTLTMKDGGRISLDTFFNGVTVDVWRRHCAIGNLHLVLRGSGTVALRIGLHRFGHAHRWLDDRLVELTASGAPRIEIAAWDRLDGGMLFFTAEAVGPVTLAGGHFATTTPPLNPVRLGIVITHYNRKRYLLPALKRLAEGLRDDPRYNVQLVVVDNSKTVTAAEAHGATILPNQNLGGSGGFMRGLLHLKAEAAATHCLFMDDDASCEVDSIKRAYALLRFARTEKFAVAGSLLREIEPFRLFEKGANFTGMCFPQKTGLDMRNVGDLLYAELLEHAPDYGGWWFFAFAIADIAQYAFPFFIRGDDIQFSMTNKLEICTVNGIASWAEDFGLKSGPLPIYLDVRSHILQKFCVLSSGLPATLRMIARFFLLALCSYNYATAQAVTIAVRDVARGPRFWRDNLDMSQKRAAINALSPPEKMVPIDRSRFNVKYRDPRETRARRLARRLTLNGFLLPSFLLKNGVLFQHKGFHGSLSSIFRYKKVMYQYEPLGLGYLAQHDKPRFFRELGAFAWEITKFSWRFNAIKNDYRNSFQDMTSEAFWRAVYAEDAAAPAMPARETVTNP